MSLSQALNQFAQNLGRYLWLFRLCRHSDLATFDHEGFSYPNPSLRKAITEKRDGYAF